MNVRLQNHCIDFTSDLKKEGSILAISNCAGGGHIEATKAICRQFFEQQSAYQNGKKKVSGQFKTVDIFQGSFPPLINRLVSYGMSYHWNKAKREGNIEAQERLYNGKIMGIAKSILVDWILFVPVFISNFFRLLLNGKITHIIITQPLGVNAIIKAARAINYLFKRSIKISMVLTDLPTEGAVHYCNPLKKLSKGDKANLNVITTKPLVLDIKETEQQWWKRVYRLHYDSIDAAKSRVHYREFPLRPAFFKWRDVPAEEKPSQLDVKINNCEEQRFIDSLLKDTKKRLLDDGKNVISIDVNPDSEIVGLVTIGSQAAIKIKNYVEDFIEVAKSLPKDRTYTLFAACGRHEPDEETLFKTVYTLCTEANLPSNIRVIPMGFQDDDEFAPLMHRMDFGIGSTGGLTSFELIRTAKNKVFLHSETDLSKPPKGIDELKNLDLNKNQKHLMEGFSLWEKWNALYQVYKNNATIIVPGEPFRSQLRNLVKNKN